MTNKEAIRRIKDHCEIHFKLERPNAIKITEALNMAIKALEQQDKERWIPISEGLPERDINSLGDVLSHSKEVLVVVKYDNYKEDGEQYIAWFDNDEYDMYVKALKTGECDDFIIPEKEAWKVYSKGTYTYEDLYKKNVVAWKPLPEYKGE